MKTMTAQEVFDTAVRGVLSQGMPSIRPGDAEPRCAFRGADGTKCANGWLIPDEFWEDSFNDLAIDEVAMALRERGLDLTQHLRPKTFNEDRLLYRLQRAHDAAAFAGGTIRTDSAFIEAFKAFAGDVATDFELNPAALNEARS